MEMQMIEKGPTTSIESLDALISETAEMLLAISRMSEDIRHRDDTIAELQSRLNQYWDLPDDVVCRSPVNRIREEHEE